MTSALQRAGRRQTVPQPLRKHDIARQLKRFRGSDRRAIAYVAGLHPRLADLAVSFPALLHALVVQRHGFPAQQVRQAAEAGAPLAALADIAGLPLWARKLPPEIFAGVIPRLPNGELFRRRVANHLPNADANERHWPEMVSATAAWAGEDFALWCAKHRLHIEPRNSWLHFQFVLVTLWAWHSVNPGGRAHWLIETPWTPDIGPTAASQAADVWYENIQTDLGFAARPATPLLKAGRVDGYDFVPLESADEVIAEAAEMQNCMRGYGSQLGTGELTFWSIRWNGTRVAALSVHRSGDNPIPRISQLKAVQNEAASADVWLAAARWLVGQDVVRLAGERMVTEEGRGTLAAWRALWKPFWMAHKRIPAWLPTCRPEAIWDLDAHGVHALSGAW